MKQTLKRTKRSPLKADSTSNSGNSQLVDLPDHLLERIASALNTHERLQLLAASKTLYNRLRLSPELWNKINVEYISKETMHWFDRWLQAHGPAVVSLQARIHGDNRTAIPHEFFKSVYSRAPNLTELNLEYFEAWNVAPYYTLVFNPPTKLPPSLTRLVLQVPSVSNNCIKCLWSLTNLQALELNYKVAHPETNEQHLNALGKLTTLTLLNLEDNTRRGIPGKELGRLTRLQRLSLYNKSFNSEGIKSLAALKPLTRLVSLDISKCRLQKLLPPLVQQLPLLQELDISENTGIRDLNMLSNLVGLTSLNLRQILVQQLPPLATLTNLQKLCISQTRWLLPNVSNLESLPSWAKSLKVLQIDHHQASRCPLGFFTVVRNIEELYVEAVIQNSRFFELDDYDDLHLPYPGEARTGFAQERFFDACTAAPKLRKLLLQAPTDVVNVDINYMMFSAALIRLVQGKPRLELVMRPYFDDGAEVDVGDDEAEFAFPRRGVGFPT